eukprot:gene8127-9680_t
MSDYGDDDEEYTYEEDGEYDDGNEPSDDGKSDSDMRENRRESGGSYKGSGSSPFNDKRAGAGGITVPSDSFNILDCSDIEPIMRSLIEDVSSLLDLSTDVTQSLLQHNKWDREKLIDAFFANPEKVMRAAGLDLYNDEILVHLEKSEELPRSSSNAGLSSPSSTALRCRICYDDTTSAFSMGCGHKFCRPCYSEYLSSQVNDGQTCIIAHCPEFKCSQIVTSEVFHNLLKDRLATPKYDTPATVTTTSTTTSTNASNSPVQGNTASSATLSSSAHTASTPSLTRKVSSRITKMVDQYDTFYVRNFIETCKNMKYCPAPGCEKVAVGSGITTVRCHCGHPFCMRCGEEAHEPSSCTQLSEWAEKCGNESETANWILANTRKCPACNARIEKNQGCNHMTCRLCKHDFCWICMGSWAEHGQTTGGFYKCNRFMPAEVKSIISAIDKAKAELDRYLHYYQRYHGHDSALKFAAAQRAQAEARMVEQQGAQKSSWIDVQFLKQAAEQVIDCRRVLKYTYVLGYFLKDGSVEKQLFEHHQEMLEKNTEKLQEYTEKSLDQIDRTQVVNLTRVTEKFMSSLLASMTGGVVTLDGSDVLLNSGASGSNGSSSSGPQNHSTAAGSKSDA